MSITPVDIAGAMSKMGWPVAAALMNRWANSAAWTMPDAVKLGSINPATLPASQFDDVIVKMSWLLRFSRAKTAYDNVVANALNGPAIVVLKERLASAGWKSGPFPLGNTSMDARTLERACQTNIVGLGSLTDTVDEFYGAIGKASFKVAVVGSVAVNGKQHVFNINKLGVYLRDTYDFNDFQPLGVWNKQRCLSKAEVAAFIAEKAARLATPALRLLPEIYAGFEEVGNSDIRAWRTQSGKGGDFVIYSDVAWINSPTPQITL